MYINPFLVNFTSIALQIHGAAIPFAIEITFVVIALLIASSIVWSTIRVGISPMPSSNKARNAIVKLTENTGTGPIYDLGSGWGGLAVRLAKQYPQRQIVGYEASLLPWLVSLWYKHLAGLNNLTFKKQNFLEVEFASADLLVCYLHTQGMAEIAQKLSHQGNFAGYLISHNFALPSTPPEHTLTVADFYRSPVYRYRLTN